MATFKDVRRGQLYGGDSDGADPFGVREYQAGDAVIGQPDAFDVSTRESRKEVPRPAGISDAPRPAASSFIRPTEGQTDVLERMKSVQAAGTVSARKAERERIEQAPIIEARREQAVKDAATEKKVAFEQELALKGESARVAGEARAEEADIVRRTDIENSIRTATTAEEKAKAEKERDDLDRQVTIDLNESNELADTRDDQTKRDIAEMQDATNRIQAEITKQGTTTPQQKVSLELVKGNNAQIRDVEQRISEERAKDEPDQELILSLHKQRELLVRSNKMIQSDITGQGVEVQDAEQATGEVGDVDGDGTPNTKADKIAGQRMSQIEAFENLLKTKPQDERITPEARAQHQRYIIEQKAWESDVKKKLEGNQ